MIPLSLDEVERLAPGRVERAVWTDEVTGVQVDSRRIAERDLHRRALNGCYSGFRFDTKTGFLVMWLEGGKALVGTRVGFLVVHSQHLNPGVLDCIDS